MRTRVAAAAALLFAFLALPMSAANAQFPLRDVEAGKLAGHCGPGRKAIGRLCINVGPKLCPPGRIRLKGHCAKLPDRVVIPGNITLPCPKGHKRRGKRCVEVGTPQVCPPGRVRRHGACVKTPDDVANPGGIVEPCPKGHKRLGKRCIEIVTPQPCPKGQVLRRGKCGAVPVPPVVTFPEEACRMGYERRGKHCVAVVPPSSPPSIAPPTAPPKTATPPPSVPPSILALTANRPHRPREILVLLPTADAQARTTDLMRRHSLVAVDSLPIPLIDATLVRLTLVDNRPLEQVLAALAGDSSIQAAQPNYRFEASEMHIAGVKHRLQYAPAKMRIPEAHAIARGRGVKLAVIDTGIDETHPEIAGAIANRFDSLREGAPRAEPHGTAITGLISARLSLQGIAPEARVLSVRAFAGGESGPPQSTSLALVRAIDWAFAAGARVFNMSFAGPRDELLGKVIAAAARKGAIFVAAAGNGGPNAPPAYPGAFPDVIAVTATDDREQIYSAATHGGHIAIAAPGVDILAPAPGAVYDFSSGTSMAAAHVTGIVALILERDPDASPAAVRTILTKTARKPNAADPAIFGAGHIDALRALENLETRAGLE
ncbi:S8 family serine peptidase [Hyphomicrobium sp.]|uniref:S8 family peptidase n=1 Tax=Hyphomicrobium sp. TaxID=82 RepID=UPI0025B927D8|nr:S8 family serine peptidase [Hyphomicrobium sp.]MCC7250968.1 S8 family serine peptidase [Hyphomicrobium sp.]